VLNANIKVAIVHKFVEKKIGVVETKGVRASWIPPDPCLEILMALCSKNIAVYSNCSDGRSEISALILQGQLSDSGVM
jgi:hypothetical protein